MIEGWADRTTMFTRDILNVTVVVCVCLATLSPGTVQGKPPPGELDRVVDRLHGTARQIDHAVRAGDVDSLVKAAGDRMHLNGLLSPLNVGAPPQYRFLSSDVVLSTARRLGGQNAALLDRIALVEEQRPRGSLSGAFIVPRQFEVEAGSAYSLEIDFMAGETAIVYAEGPIGAELDMLVVDADDNHICEDNSPGSYMLCRWVPPRQARVHVRIVNRTSTFSRFFFLTN